MGLSFNSVKDPLGSSQTPVLAKGWRSLFVGKKKCSGPFALLGIQAYTKSPVTLWWKEKGLDVP